MLCFCWVNLVAKTVAHQIPSPYPTAREISWILFSSPRFYLMGLLYLSCAALYMVSLRLMALSTVGPLYLSLGAVATFLLGVLFFHESFSYVRLVGVGFCMLGIALLTAR
jgi:multidrug transporter EmrE-like cation transporter